MEQEDRYDAIAESLSKNRLLFRALGDLERQSIILLLARHQYLSVSELTLHTQLSRPAVSHHLRLLKEAGLLRETKKGVRRYYFPSFDDGIRSTQELINAIMKKKELL